ncbi:MAG TPA: RNA polymerase subunit sigma-24 [Desulfobacteraceae bacterium]|nr:RNA polymerase subunit sigma-24 [Desulfobacteraceae bacterium]|tara:strand:- start:470 stop:1078 length:609 start_codon:yes stop_codon:yes gene_type:complete
MRSAPRSNHPASKNEFQDIYTSLQPKILNYLSRLLGPEEAEDLTQEVFDKVSRNLKKFKGKSKPSTWVYRIATNTAIDKLRSAERKQSGNASSLSENTNTPTAASSILPEPPAPDEMVVAREMNACINEFIDALPLNYRTILVLSELEGFSTRELADAFGISPSNAKVRLHRARAALKKALEAGCDFYYNDKNALACDRKQS